MNWSYKPGFRAIKTTIVVLLCLVVSALLKRENTFYAAIAAVVCLQPTYEQTFQLGLNRAIGTIIGGLFGYLVIELCADIPYYHQYWHLLIVPAGVLLLIYICNIINKKAAVSICCIVFLSITANSSRDITHALSYVVNRVLDTSIGIVLAMFVNRFIVPRQKVGTKKETATKQPICEEKV